jgi:hypothetical protein
VRLTANHIESCLCCVLQKVKFLLLANVDGEIVDQLLRVLDEDWNEGLEDFEVERVIEGFSVDLPDVI